MHKSGISLEKLNKIAFLRGLKTIVFTYYVDKNESSPMDCFFVFGCNEAHLRCMKNEAELRSVKRAFGSGRG